MDALGLRIRFALPPPANEATARKSKAFLIDNVAGLLSMSKGAVLEDMIARAEALGCTADGQRIAPPGPTNLSRKKVRMAVNDQPSLFLSLEQAAPALTVRDAISDLPEHALAPGETHLPLDYPCEPLTDFQRRMCGNCTVPPTTRRSGCSPSVACASPCCIQATTGPGLWRGSRPAAFQGR